jgi:hypothetical protein
MSQSKNDWRAVLGIPPGEDVTRDVIERQYKRLSLTMHPNKGGSSVNFQKLSNAKNKGLDFVNRQYWGIFENSPSRPSSRSSSRPSSNSNNEDVPADPRVLEITLKIREAVILALSPATRHEFVSMWIDPMLSIKQKILLCTFFRDDRNRVVIQFPDKRRKVISSPLPPDLRPDDPEVDIEIIIPLVDDIFRALKKHGIIHTDDHGMMFFGTYMSVRRIQKFVDFGTPLQFDPTMSWYNYQTLQSVKKELRKRRDEMAAEKRKRNGIATLHERQAQAGVRPSWPPWNDAQTLKRAKKT